jgi:hypothetical protein
MHESQENLKSLLAHSPDDVCFGIAAHASGEVFAQAGDKSLLPFPDVVDAALLPANIVSRYEECEWPSANPVPRGYARGRLSTVMGIPKPGVLLVLFGLMPEAVADTAADSNARIAWYWSHRQRVWSAVEAAYSA